MDWDLAPEELQEIVAEFRANTTELLRILNTQLLRLERNPADPGPVREMFLCAHTIKGGAAMLGLDGIRQLTHSVEDVLATLRDGNRSLDRHLADLLFRAFDILTTLVAETAEGNTTPDSRATELVLMLRDWQTPPQQPLTTEAPAPSTAPRVLLIEDSTTVRALETMALLEAGYVVDAIADGKQALALALAHSYDLIISGAETRGLRGLDLACALRAIPSRARVPIIVISSDNTPEHRERAAAAGVVALVQRGSVDHQPLLEAAQHVLASGYTVNHPSVRQVAPPGML